MPTEIKGRGRPTRSSDLDAYLDRLKALFVASGRDEAEGVLFRVVLGAESVATTLFLCSGQQKASSRIEMTPCKTAKPTRCHSMPFAGFRRAMKDSRLDFSDPF
jgi:hypothetical protein